MLPLFIIEVTVDSNEVVMALVEMVIEDSSSGASALSWGWCLKRSAAFAVTRVLYIPKLMEMLDLESNGLAFRVGGAG